MRAAALVAILALAGCASPSDGPATADCDRADGYALRAFGSTYNAGEPNDYLYFAASDVPSTLEATANDGSETYSQPYAVFGDGAPIPFDDTRWTPAFGTTHFGALRVPPLGKSSDRFVTSFQLHTACGANAGGLVSGMVQQRVDGAAASPGQGVHVWYAGFWENGTLFDTNLQDVDQSSWPRAGWYEGGHWDPLPVYVYDQDRSEQPAYWKGAGGNLAALPPTGSPADTAKATAGGTADGAAGTGYYSTIKGFNEAVKGLPAGTRQAFHLAPEDAYTQPGREGHPLYGAALVFLVEVQDVVDQPCPSPAMVGQACPG